MSCWLFIYHATMSSIRSSLPLSNIILLKLLFSPFMIESSKLRVINKSLLLIALTCCFWHYRSLYSSCTSFILVGNFFYCYRLDKILFTEPFFLFQFWKLQIICIPTPLWSSSRIRPWSLIPQQIIICMLVILNFSYHSQLSALDSSHNITHLENTMG